MMFGTLPPFPLEAGQIQSAFAFDTKHFKRGSYAKLETIQMGYNEELHKLTLHVCYEVYSNAGIVQWPVNHDDGLEDV